MRDFILFFVKGRSTNITKYILSVNANVVIIKATKTFMSMKYVITNSLIVVTVMFPWYVC